MQQFLKFWFEIGTKSALKSNANLVPYLQFLIIKKGFPLYEIQCRVDAFFCLNGASIKMQKYLVRTTRPNLFDGLHSQKMIVILSLYILIGLNRLKS